LSAVIKAKPRNKQELEGELPCGLSTINPRIDVSMKRKEEKQHNNEHFTFLFDAT